MKPPINVFFKNITTTRIFTLLICVSIFTINLSAQKGIHVGGIGSRSESSTGLFAPTPITLPNNPSCATLNASSDPAFAHITSNNELRLNFEPPAGNSGPYPFTVGGGRELTGPSDANNSVSLQSVNSSVDTFDFTSTKIITAVIVKGGSNSNVYAYSSGSLGDTGLTSPNAGPAVSHISFCFAAVATVTIIKEVANENGSSPTDFTFTTQNLNPASFTLDDDADPTLQDRIIFNNVAPGASSVTESDPFGTGFELIGGNCTETGGVANSSFNVVTRTATINAEVGESIVCTFRNGAIPVSAANGMISGRALNTKGRPISKARVFLTDSSGALRQAITNSFGYYTFEDIPAGETYIIEANHKQYTFSPIVINLTDSLTEANLIGQ